METSTYTETYAPIEEINPGTTVRIAHFGGRIENLHALLVAQRDFSILHTDDFHVGLASTTGDIMLGYLSKSEGNPPIQVNGYNCISGMVTIGYKKGDRTRASVRSHLVLKKPPS